jgi:pyruvate kinase
MLDYDKLWQGHSLSHKADVTQAVACGAVEIARDLGAAAIVTFTESGYTAKLVSSLRPRAPIVAATPTSGVARQLRLCWGVESFVVPKANNTDEVFKRALQAAKLAGLKKGGKIVLTAGTPVGEPGSTNLIRVTGIG